MLIFFKFCNADMYFTFILKSTSIIQRYKYSSFAIVYVGEINFPIYKFLPPAINGIVYVFLFIGSGLKICVIFIRHYKSA